MRVRAGITVQRVATSRARAGFTLVEVLVAVLLVDVGLLALAAGCAILIRQTTLLRARATALELASNRLEALAVRPCGASAGVADVPGGFRETWSVRMLSAGAREIRDSVAFTMRGESGTVVLTTRAPC